MPAFPDIAKIRYEGPQSKNPLAFRQYDPDERVEGKAMKDHLRFSVAYWHTMRGTGSDPFGPGTRRFPWERDSAMATAEAKIDAAFEFFTKLDVPYYCFHDVDMAPDADDTTKVPTYEGTRDPCCSLTSHSAMLRCGGPMGRSDAPPPNEPPVCAPASVTRLPAHQITAA